MSNRQPSVPLLMTVLVVAELSSAFEMSMIYSALSTLYRIYADPVGVGWLITAFLLISAAAAAICAGLGDMYGRSRVLVVMLALAALGSVISAVSTDLGWIVAGRCVQGVAAAILPLCFGLVREKIPAPSVPLCIGIVAGTAALGSAMGFLLGGVIVDHLPWQWLFYFSALLAGLGLVLCLLFLPMERPQEQIKRHDLAGGLLFVPAIAGVLYGITEARNWGWIDARTLGLLAVSVALLAFWVRHELRQANPLIDVRLLANRQVALANLAFGATAFGAMQSQLVTLPLMQQPQWTLVGLGATATLAGVLKASSSLFGAMGAPTSGLLASRAGARASMLGGAAVVFLSFVVLTFNHSSLWLVALVSCFAVFGMSVIYAAVPTLILDVAPPDRVSEAAGLSSVTRAIMGAVGAQVIATVLASSTVSDPNHGPGIYPAATAYTWAFGMIALSSVVCLLISLMLPKPKRTPVTAPDYEPTGASVAPNPSRR